MVSIIEVCGIEMMDRFDPEQLILESWNITKDLNTLLEGSSELTDDQKLNIIRGLIDLYDLKFDKTFKTFEQLVASKKIL